MENEFFDKELGRIILVRNARAKNIIARRKEGYVQLTVPTLYSASHIKKVFEELKPRLLSLKVKPKYLFLPQLEFRSFSFDLNLAEGRLSSYHFKLHDGILSISTPANVNFEEAEVQENIRELIEKALRFEAKRIFPSRVKELARKFNFDVGDVKINKSRTRWGSCSHKKNINLSYFCLLLPAYLIDFIILHELSHTCQMNHSASFWMHLDNVTGGNAKKLTTELRTTTIKW